MSAGDGVRGRHPAHVQWTAGQLALMGKLPDVDVAARAGVSPSAVARERRRRGIARWNGRRDPVEWTEPMLSLLGTDTDANVAAELGIHPASANHRRRVLGVPSFGLSPARSRSKVVWSRRALALLARPRMPWWPASCD